MTETRDDHSTTVTHFVAAVVNRLGDRLAEVTSSIQKILVTEIAEMGDAELLQVLQDSVDANVDTLFSAIRHAIPIEHVEPPTAALEHARRLAQRGMSVNALVRAYRLGHKAVLNVALNEVGALNLEPQLSLEVLRQIAEVTFGYIDWMSQQVVATYESERDRWVENRNSLRAWQVRELLEGADTDVDSMTTAIRYPLRRIHLSVVVWCSESGSGDQLVPMERFIDQLAESLGAREASLFIPVDRLTAWAWIPLPANATSNAVTRLREFAEARTDAPWIAAGNPLPGIDGFRRSHRQAQIARAVASASGVNAPRITAASDAGLSMTALLGRSLDEARAWVDEVLGPLASRAESDERLRETLRVFLATGSSFTAAAAELHLHFNSVKYRVQRAIERRGRPITDDRLDVEAALLLCHRLGTAVLS